ncbi:MAG: hypothetical protein NC236_02760 [Mycoplasma sp.]|nr:hypothetical protein [Mycoplasma sp.]
MNFKRNIYFNNLNFKIALTGLMLSLVLLFQYLEKFMPFGEVYMNLNLSLIFIMITLYILDFKWALLLLVLRFAIGPAIGSFGYSTLGIWNNFVLFLCGLIFCVMFFVLHKHFKKSTSLSLKNNFIISTLISTLLITIIAPLLNSVLFTPMYWYLLDVIKSPSISNAIDGYSYVYSVAFFSISNYWLGMFVAFGVANLAKFSIISVVFVVVARIWTYKEVKKGVKEISNEAKSKSISN